MIDRFEIAALCDEPHAETGVGGEIFWIQSQGGFEFGDGPGRVSELRERQAKVSVGGRTTRRSADRRSERRGGFVELSGIVSAPPLDHEGALAAKQRLKIIDERIRDSDPA